MSENEKSLPCPFCGATPHHGLTKVQHCQLHGEPFQRFKIWCPRGHATIEGVNQERAAEAWNRRAALSTPPSEADADEVERDTSEDWYSAAQLDEVTPQGANEWLEWTRLEGGCADIQTVKAMHEKIRAAFSAIQSRDAGLGRLLSAWLRSDQIGFRHGPPITRQALINDIADAVEKLDFVALLTGGEK